MDGFLWSCTRCVQVVRCHHECLISKGRLQVSCGAYSYLCYIVSAHLVPMGDHVIHMHRTPTMRVTWCSRQLPPATSATFQHRRSNPSPRPDADSQNRMRASFALQFFRIHACCVWRGRWETNIRPRSSCLPASRLSRYLLLWVYSGCFRGCLHLKDF